MGGINAWLKEGKAGRTPVKLIELPEGEKQCDRHKDPFSLCAVAVHLSSHALSAGDGFFWERCKGWPILACVYVCMEGDQQLSLTATTACAPSSWPHTQKPFFQLLRREEHIFCQSVHTAEFKKENKFLFCMCVIVCKLFSVSGKYSDADLFSQEIESRLGPQQLPLCLYLSSPL